MDAVHDAHASQSISILDEVTPCRESYPKDSQTLEPRRLKLMLALLAASVGGNGSHKVKRL